MRSLIKLITILSLFVTVACSPASTGGGPATRVGLPDPNVLRAEDLAGFPTVLQAVQTLRSQWLRTRASVSFGNSEPVKVYRDGVLLGGAEALEHAGTLDIVTVQYLDGRVASQRWGLGHENGAIVISSRNR